MRFTLIQLVPSSGYIVLPTRLNGYVYDVYIIHSSLGCCLFGPVNATFNSQPIAYVDEVIISHTVQLLLPKLLSFKKVVSELKKIIQ